MVIIADVLYTRTDETFYVLNGESKYLKQYKQLDMEEVIGTLKNDGWDLYGKVYRHDNVLVDMFIKENDYIAIWEQ